MKPTTNTRTVSADYLSIMFDGDRRREYLDRLKRTVQWFEANHQPFQYIAVCGVSGLTIGSLVAHHLGKQLLIVRKADDTSTHSYNRIEGLQIEEHYGVAGWCERSTMVGGNYVFLDDLIASGASLRYVVAMIHQFSVAMASQRNVELNHLNFVGAILYDSNEKPILAAPRRRLPPMDTKSIGAQTLYKKIHSSLSHGGWMPYKEIDDDVIAYYNSLFPTRYVSIGDDRDDHFNL